MVTCHGCSWLTAAKSNTNTMSQGAQKTVHDWLIISCETHHSAMGWTLIIASFKAQSIRLLLADSCKIKYKHNKGAQKTVQF